MKLLMEFIDDSPPFQGDYFEKHTARAIIFNEDKHIALVNYAGVYNEKTYNFHGTPGGGIEPGETPDMALKREISEELGYECRILSEIGIIIDYYNEIGRKTTSYYFIAETIEKKSANWTENEKEIIKGIKWVSLDEAKNILEQKNSYAIGRVIQRRDLFVINEISIDLLKNTSI
jgi:ADP-ribose pyrophosphatase